MPAITVRHEGRTSRLAAGAESVMTRAENMDGERLACLGRLLQPPPCLRWIPVGSQVRRASHAVGRASVGPPLEPASPLRPAGVRVQPPQPHYRLAVPPFGLP